MKVLVVLALSALGPLGFAQFTVFAAESPAGTLGGNTALYGGIQQYDFSGTGGGFTTGPGLAPTAVADPVGVVVRGGNLYVGNRHGNNQGQGSVQEFPWDGVSLGGGTTIATAASGSSQGFHGFNFAPNGDLFVSTVGNGTRWYRDSGSGYVEIGGTSSGSVRDAWVSPDGLKLIETRTDGNLAVTDILANTLGSTNLFGISGAGSMHQMAYMGGDLFVTSFNTSSVHRVALDAGFNPVSSSTILSTSGAIGITFSPDGGEMFVSSHMGNKISRYLWGGGTWNANGEFATGSNMGYLAAVPEPGSMIALGLGLLASLRRKR